MSPDAWMVLTMGAVAGVLTASCVPLARRAALRLGITDQPAPGKWHRVPTPYLGGVAVAAVAVAVAGSASGWERGTAVLLVAALATGAVGLLDDVRTVPPAARLAVEAAAAVTVFAAGAQVHLVGGVGDLILTVLWLVVVTNSFNLLDNLDGALGSIAAITATAVAGAAFLGGQIRVGALAVVVAGACVGFLVHNWHPARIFMGDAGALFVGFLLAAAALELRPAVDPVSGVVALACLMGTMLFDTTLVVLSRVRAGRSILVGGTDHTAHRLLRLGLRPPTVVLVLVSGTALSAGLGVVVARGWAPAGLAAAGLGAAALVALVGLWRVPVYLPDPASRRRWAAVPRVVPVGYRVAFGGPPRALLARRAAPAPDRRPDQPADGPVAQVPAGEHPGVGAGRRVAELRRRETAANRAVRRRGTAGSAATAGSELAGTDRSGTGPPIEWKGST